MFSYALGFLEASPLLAREIVGKTTTEIRLRNGNAIAVHANSYRTVRGKTLLCCIFDEVAWWRDETSALPDVETYRAILPALATTNGMLVAIGSPYRKTGLLYTKHRDFFASDNNEVLVVQGASRLFNPTLDQTIITSAKNSDPEAARSEWDAEFRSDISSFLNDEAIEKVIDYARSLEIPPRNGIQYAAGVDPSGGRHDHFCICVGHCEGLGAGSYYVADVVRGRAPPFDPQSVAEEYAALLKAYKVHSVTGDNYSAEFVSSAFVKQGITYNRSEMNKSQLYIEALPLFMRQNLGLPNHPKLIRELRLLERRTSRMGRDVVDHSVHGSDDYANALAVTLRCMAKAVDVSMASVDNDEDEHQDGKQGHCVQMLNAYLAQRGIFPSGT